MMLQAIDLTISSNTSFIPGIYILPNRIRFEGSGITKEGKWCLDMGTAIMSMGYQQLLEKKSPIEIGELRKICLSETIWLCI